MLTLAAFVVVVAGMKSAAAVLNPFLLSGFIAIVSTTPMFWLQNRGVPQTLALLIVVVGIVTIVTLAVGLIGQSIAGFTRDLPAYQQKLKGLTTEFLVWLNGMGVDAGTLAIDEIFNPGAAMRMVGSLLNSLGSMLTNGFLILMTIIFMLFESAGLPAKLQAMLGKPDTSLQRWSETISNIKHYFVMKTLISIITGGVVAIWLILLGVDYALLWGGVAFAFNFVPNIGSIIAAVPAVLLAMVQLGLLKALAVAGGYLAVNLIIGNAVEPRFMGRGLGLSTLVVFLSLIFWGWVLGPVGMLLSIPLTITAKIALDSRDDTRWLSILLGP